MPDPHKTLAPIIEPVAPPALPAGPDFLLPALALTGLVLLFALAIWHWRHRAPLRALRRIAQQADPMLAADQLAAWVRAHKIQPTQEWLLGLEYLRFGPPKPDAAARLARLCRDIDRPSRAGGKDGT